MTSALSRSDDLYAQCCARLAAARRSRVCAESLLISGEDAAAETGLLLARGWHALACAQALMAGVPEPAPRDFLPLRDTPPLLFTAELTREEWESDLKRFCAIADEPPWAECEGCPGPRLPAHCDLLDQYCRRLKYEVRRYYGKLVWTPRRKRILGALAAGAVLIGIAVGVFKYFNRPPFLWRVRFFDNTALSGDPIKERRYREIDFDWEHASPVGKFDNYSARFDSCFIASAPLKLELILTSDDGSRLKIDGREVIDNWAVQAMTTKTRNLTLEPGVHHLEVEFFQETLGSIIRFSAVSQESSRPVLDDGHLRFPRGAGSEACGGVTGGKS